MAGETFGGLDITMPCTDTGVVEGAVVVVTTTGVAALPAAAASATVIGVSRETFQTSTHGITVRILGVANCISDGSAAIDEGDIVEVADNTGKIKTVTANFNGSTNASVVGRAITAAANTSGLRVKVLLAGPATLIRP